MKNQVVIIQVCICLLLLLTTKSRGQYENIWIFGNGAGLDFNNGTPIAIKSNITGFGEGCASVCDRYGKLLFYTEGSYVWDRNHNRIPNGQDLISDLPPSEEQNGYTGSTSQGVLIVPMPDSVHKFYIFSLTAWEEGRNLGRLYYSVLNMDLNGGLGDIEVGQKGILLDTMLTEHMTGVVGDQCNQWVIVSSRQAPNLKSYEITNAGINPTPVISEFSVNNSQFVFGKMAISPNRRKMAIGRASMLGMTGSLELYDFDPSTGVFSNQMILEPRIGHYGVCFSPNNSILYSNPQFSQLEQYDLSSGDLNTIKNSKIWIASTGFIDIKYAPDGKIYFRSESANNTLSAITFPDRRGLACQLNTNAVSLLNGTRMHSGLPNVVPVFQRIGPSTEAQYELGGCFTNQLSIKPKDTTGWGYTWNNGNHSKELTINSAGTYWVSYHLPPCNMVVDTFHIHFPNGILPTIKTQPSCKNSSNGSAYAYTYSSDTVKYQYRWLDSNNDTVSVTDTIDL